MAEQNKARCPGCSRHCSAENIRCGYGRKYFDKLARKTETEKKRSKWEKHVVSGGLLWQFLHAGRQSKRLLKRRKLGEQEWLLLLTAPERAQLEMLLQKISKGLE